MSNAIRAYLSDLERGFDSITYETPLDVAVEIEMVRQEGVTILKEAEGDARRIREEAREDAEATLSASKREAESARSSAREYYNSVVSIAHKEADAIRAQAAAEAETIKADAKHIAEERRERRSKRRAFIASHRKLVIGACLCLAAVIAALFTLAHRDIQAKLEAKLIPIGIDSSNCIGAQYREI